MPAYREPRVLPAGDRCLVVEFGDGIDEAVNARVRALSMLLSAEAHPAVVETVPTYRSLMVHFDPLRASPGEIEALAYALDAMRGEVRLPPAKVVDIPCTYGGAFGPDLPFVARHAGLSEAEVVAMHSGVEYLVYMMGFTPGFPYLGGLAPRIATPRLATPRTLVPAGSVGIAGEQTGIYPTDSPGGWQLIARTPLRLFDVRREPPVWFDAGDYVRFVPVAPEEYDTVQRAIDRGTFAPGVRSRAEPRPAADVDRTVILVGTGDLGPAVRLAGARSGRPAVRQAHRTLSMSKGEQGRRAGAGLATVGRVRRTRQITCGCGSQMSVTSARACRVVDGGLFTTVQDLGRTGYQRYGVPVSGAMDPFALRAANLLVGNHDSLACLEATAIGPEIVFESAVWIAVTGGDLGPRLDGRPLRMWQSVEVPAGACLSFSGRRLGLRAYIACAGGFDVPVVLGSRSTFTRSGIGGFEGRHLRAGDELRIGEPTASGAGQRRLVPRIVPGCGSEYLVRVMVGPQTDAFTSEGLATLLGEEYTVSSQSDRIGCRLQGPVIGHVAGADIVSDGTAFGTVQVSGDGQPIVLMADRGTTGGYTKIATVISADLMHIAQAAPGDRVRFRAVTFDEAFDALRGLEAALASIAADDGRLNFDKPDGEVFDEDGADAFLAEASGEWAEEIEQSGRRK